MRNNVCVWAFVILAVAAGTSQGQYNLDGGIGYARISLDGDNGDDISGWGPAFRFWFGDPMESNGLKPYLGLHSTSYPGDNDDDPIWDIWMFTPEIGLAWHESLGESGLFIEPSLAVGAVVSTFTYRGDFYASYFVGEDDTAFGWSVRPGVLLGYQQDTWSLGLEASYGILNVDFSDEVRFVFNRELYYSPEVKGTHEELYIGLFGRFSW